MKKILLTTLALTGILFGASANQEINVEQDSTKKFSKNIEIEIGKKEENKNSSYPRVYGGLTFSRIDWGFSRLIDDGSFNLTGDNDFLSYSKASNFGFDVAQVGVRFNDNFKVYSAVGFEWNYIRLENSNVLLKQDVAPLDHDIATGSYRKNRLTSTYLRVPLTFEWRSAKNKNGDRLKVAFGPTTGILLKGSQRVKSKEHGNQKFKDSFNFNSFQYGGLVRVGYDNFGVFAKYYANDFFEKSPNQEGINNFAFGLTLGF